MSEIYKGHRVITIVTSPYGGGKVTHVVYRVDRKDGDDWRLAREGTSYGPFDSLEGARTSAESVARGWIDQQGTEGELQRGRLDTTAHRDARERYREALAKLRVHIAREEPRDVGSTYPGAKLGPCPRCGKPEGKMRDIGRDKFRHYVICGGCQWMTALSRTEGIAAKLWNEAKPAKETPARSGRRRRQAVPLREG